MNNLELIARLDELAEKATKTVAPMDFESFKEWWVEDRDFKGEQRPAVVYYDKDEVISRDSKSEIAHYIVALHNAYPKLRAMALAGEELAQAVNEAALIESHGKCRQKVNFALIAYERLKG